MLNVLFLCTHNSARSVLAECVLNHLGGNRFHGFSAGSAPRGKVHPLAIDLCDSLGYDTRNLRSKSWDEFSGPAAPVIDIVVTVCDNAANETCPLWPGQPMTAHWGIPDPSAVEGSDSARRAAFAEAHMKLYRRIETLTKLPIETLPLPARKATLQEIGRLDV